MTLTSLVQITLPEDKHGCLTLRLEHQKSELWLKRLVKISIRIDIKSLANAGIFLPLLSTSSICTNIVFSTVKVVVIFLSLLVTIMGSNICHDEKFIYLFFDRYNLVFSINKFSLTRLIYWSIFVLTCLTLNQQKMTWFIIHVKTGWPILTCCATRETLISIIVIWS